LPGLLRILTTDIHLIFHMYLYKKV